MVTMMRKTGIFDCYNLRCKFYSFFTSFDFRSTLVQKSQ